MSPAQRNLVKLEKQKEDVKKFYEQLNEAIQAVVKENGLNSYFQDEEGTVYKVIEPAGRFVTFDKVSVVRTRRIHEERGELSLKEAEAAGFNVPKK